MSVTDIIYHKIDHICVMSDMSQHWSPDCEGFSDVLLLANATLSHDQSAEFWTTICLGVLPTRNTRKIFKESSNKCLHKISLVA